MLACIVVSFSFGYGWSYDVMFESSTKVTAETYATRKSCRTAIQLAQRAVRAGRQYGGTDHSCSCHAASGPLLVANSVTKSIEVIERFVWKGKVALIAASDLYLSAESCGVKVKESSS